MGVIQHISPGTSQDYLVAAINQVIDAINAQQRSQTINDGTSNRFLFGYQKGGFPHGDFGMKIAPPGVDVTTADNSKLLFYWDFTSNTQYWIDVNTGKNYMQEGTLPDGVGGLFVAKIGSNVADVF